MEKNSDRGISNFRISGQSFKNENCQNSIASHDIDMKLGPVTKLDKTNMAIKKKKKKKKKKIDDDTISANCDFIVFFLIYGQFTVIRKPDSERMVSYYCFE